MKYLLLASVLLTAFAGIYLYQSEVPDMESMVESILQPEIIQTPTPFSEELGLDLAYFANIAYCAPNKIARWKCGHMCKTHPTMSNIITISNGIIKNNHAYLGYNSKLDAIVIAWRGTLAVQNWLEDFDTIPTKYPYCNGCQVHEGFYHTYLSMQTQFWNAFNTIRAAYPNAKIMLTGHSLGAALSTFNAADLIQHGINAFTWYNYGGPRCGNQAFATWLQSTYTQTLYRVTHHKDPVPHVPTESMGFRHPAQEVFYEHHSKPTDYHKLCNMTGEDPTCSDKYKVDGDALDHLEYMGLEIAVNAAKCQL